MKQRVGQPETGWERDIMLESLEAYRRGLCESPLIRKWSPVCGNDAELAPADGPGNDDGHAESPCMSFVFSTDEVDRHGDVIDAGGWQLDAYKRNPVFLWAHDYARPVIGKAVDVWKEPHSLMAKVQFAPTEFAREVAGLYLAGFQRGVSVGFKPLRYEERRHEKTGALLGLRFLEQELLETSAVPVPSNRSALRRALAQSGFAKTGLEGEWPELAARLDDLEKLTAELADMVALAGGPPESAEAQYDLEALRG